MAAESCHTFKISEVVKGMTLKIRLSGVRVFTWRFRIATWLIKLAAIVCPWNVTIQTEGGND